ncbi:MAG: toxin-antitoxin system HicB family antitoxin [Stellaceae bacterium]
MKRIIGGKTYNTDTAALVASVSNQYSEAGSDLYQTRHGAFFKVVTDHSGEEQTLLPMTDSEAQIFLEKFANHLLEQYFGPFPEAGAAERRLTIRIPGNLADRLEAAAKARGLSLNSYAMRCFELCATADGQRPV